ncbi:unnamed protein product, partial [Symbiodinium sp. CCMP2592]
AWSQSKKAEAGTRCVLGRDEAGALILNQYGVPGGKAEAGTRPERLSSTNVESQVRDLGPKKVEVGCLKPEEGELQEEVTTSSKDLLSEYVLGAWSQPEEDRGGDKAGSPILNWHGFPGSWSGENRSRDQAGVPILNQYGVPGARSQLEEDGGGNQAGALLLNQNRVGGAWSQLEQDGGEERPECLSSTKIGSQVHGFILEKRERKLKLKKTEAGKLKMKKGKDKVRILKKKKAGSGNEAVQARLHGVPGAWSQSKKAEAGTRPAQYGVPGAWSQPEEGGGGDEAGAGVPGAKAEAGTRPERLSSTNVESQVRDLGPKKVKVGCLKPEEGELQEEATTSSKDLLSEYVLGAWSQPEEDRGGDKVRGLNLKRMEAGTRPEHFSSTNIGSEVRGLNSNRKLKLKKTEVWKFKLKKTQAWKLKLKKGKDKVRILKKKKAGSGNEAVQARLHGVPGAWSQSKKAEAGTRPAQYGVPGAWSQPEEGGGGDEVRDLGPKKVKVGCLKPEEGELQEEATTSSKDLLSEYVLGAWSQPEEDRGGDKVRGLNLKRMEAGTRPEHFSSTNIGSEVRGLNSNRKLKLKKTEVWKFKLKKTQAWKLKLKKGKDKVWKLKPKKTEARTIQGMEACVEAHKSKKTEARIRCVKKKKAGSGNEAVQARLHGVPGAWSQSKKAEAGTRPAQYGVPGAWSQPEEGGGGDEAGTRPERLSSTNVESQVRDLGPKKVKVGCLKPEEGELQEEATTSSKDLLSEYVLGAWSQPEEDRGGDKVRGLNLKRMEAGTRPEHFSSTNIGSEVRGLNSNRKLKLKKTEVWKFKLKKTQAWKLKLKKGKDKVRILKKKKAGSGNEAVQARLHGAWSQSKKAEAGTRPAQYGVPGAWSQPEEGGGGDEAGAGVPGAKAEAGTRPERLSSTNVESQVRDLGPKKVKVGCLKPEEGELQEEATTGSKDLLSEYVLGAWSQPEEDGGGDKAGSPILNCHGFPGSWSGENRSRDQAGVPILKQYGVPGARSQLEEDGGGNQAGALVLNQYRVRGAWSQLEQDGGEERPEYLCKDKAGRAHPQPTWGSEVRKFKLKKTQVWKFKLKKTEAWKLKLKKGKDKAWKLKLKETEAWKLKLKKGKNKAWKLKLKKGKNKAWTLKRKKTEAWTLKRKKTEARRRPGVDAQAEEDGGKDQAWKLKRKKTEARTRRTLKETESPKASHGECKEYARYLGIDPGYEGEETHNAMLCPSLGAWSQPEKNTEAGGGDVSSTKMRSGDEAGALIINQDGVSGAWSQAEDGGGGDEAGALIINQDGVSGAWSQAEEGAGGDEAGALILNQDGVSGAWSEAEKTAEVGTRPERLSSTKMGFQVLGLKLRRRRRRGRGGDEAGALILNQDGVSGAWSQAEDGGGGDEAGGDEAGALVLNQYGVSGGDEAGALVLNQYGVPGACSQARDFNLKKNEAGIGVHFTSRRDEEIAQSAMHACSRLVGSWTGGFEREASEPVAQLQLGLRRAIETSSSRQLDAMDTPVLFSALNCTCRTAAKKWTRLPHNLKLAISQFTRRSDWALRLGHLALIGALSRYPMLASRATDDFDFGRRLQYFSVQDLQGLPRNTKKTIRLCIANLRAFEKKKKQKERTELRKQKQEELLRRKFEATKIVVERAA